MKRYALFVGVDKYADPEIRNLDYASDDARSLHDIFEDLGYETMLLKNPGQGEIFRVVRTMSAGLGAGDRFVFYFSGHGFTDDGQHLLFCSDDVYASLRYKRAGMPFGLLEEETRVCGCDRVFVIDACRSDFLTGSKGSDATTKDLCAISDMVPASDDATGAYYVLRSCSRYEHSIEIDAKRHGLFTLAMMEVVRESKKSGSELLFNDDFRETVKDRMARIAREVGISIVQTPESEGRGAAQVLLSGQKPAASVSASAPSVTYVVCPECGFRNKEESTFRCRVCGRDYLCARHYDDDSNCCYECAEKKISAVQVQLKELKEVTAQKSSDPERLSGRRVQLWEGGPYWADRNIGAENPWDSGCYFWWGDTVGYKRKGRKWVAGDDQSRVFLFSSGSTPTHGKDLLKLQHNGWITKDGVLCSEHDPAKKHWGGNWRMPTKQEFEELVEKCEWSRVRKKGVNGYTVHGRGDFTSSSIFLPAAGRGDGASRYLDGLYGYYWSSVPYLDDCKMDAWNLYLDSNIGFRFVHRDFRYRGLSVRAVQGFTK